MNRKFYLHTEEESFDNHIYKSYLATQEGIKNKQNIILHTYDINSLCFDLLDEGFSEISVILPNKIIEVKLGENDWIDKDLRKEHNIKKILTAYLQKYL